jgi:hypothetical protein
MRNREPDVRTPLGRGELKALRADMKGQPVSKVHETYRTMWEMSKMFGDAPPRPVGHSDVGGRNFTGATHLPGLTGSILSGFCRLNRF